jgi:hypothetical protein
MRHTNLKQLFVGISFAHVRLSPLDRISPLTDTEQPLSVSFLRYQPGTRMALPIIFLNQDDNIEIRRGAHIHVINRFLSPDSPSPDSPSLPCPSFVKVVCTRPNDIPAQIFADVANVKAGEAIRLSDCDLPTGIIPLLGRGTDIVLAKVQKD